jgi:hypothetical protein
MIESVNRHPGWFSTSRRRCRRARNRITSAWPLRTAFRTRKAGAEGANWLPAIQDPKVTQAVEQLAR